MGYREKFFNNNQGVMGMYQCAKCGGWFPKSEIDIDHKIPKRLGGTDDLFNLQATCKTCNRSKGDDLNIKDITSSVLTAGIQGLANNGIEGATVNLTKIGKGIAKRKLKDTLGIKYKR